MSVITISNPSDLRILPAAPTTDEKPLYVCVAGQSGAGKSTILRTLTELVAERRTNIVVLDEKALHPPYIDQLFLAPSRYAFELQLQFMVNRVLFVKRWIASGYSVLMERSHAEDPVFIRHLYALNHVTDDERDAYMALWTSLAKRVPTPDLLVFLDVPVQVSVQRLARARPILDRPPFPDEAARRAWIASWHYLYRERFKDLQSDPKRLRILRFSYPVNTKRLCDTVTRALDTPPK